MDAKFCDSCSTPIRDGAKFCPNCRHAVQQINPNQKKNAPSSKEQVQKNRSKASDSKQTITSPSKGKKPNGAPEAASYGQNRGGMSQKAVKKPPGRLLVTGISLGAGLFLLLLTVGGLVFGGLFYDWVRARPVATASEEDVFAQETASKPLDSEIAALVSPDQLAILAVEGLPQAFTIYIDPQTGSVLEQWSYYTLGREINFTDGQYQGGIEVPLEIDTAVSVPQPAIYPWEILGRFTPESVIDLAGSAIFRTSALVLPGWNDGYEVARLWMLAGGGNMITVDGNLALLSIDPGEAIDLDQFSVDSLFVGTLEEGDNRWGAILSPGKRSGTYRLSHSVRGQGTTRDGTEFVVDLEGPQLEGVFKMGKDAWVSMVDMDGSEIPIEVDGTVTITGQGGGYLAKIETITDGSDYNFSGLMGSGLWRSGDPSTREAIGQADTFPKSAADKPGTTPGLPLVLEDTFDSNINQWPISHGTYGESAYYQSDIFEGRYLLLVQREKGERPWVSRLIDADLGPRFQISIEVVQDGGPDTDGGLIVASEESMTGFFVSAADGKFRVTHFDSGHWHDSIGWTDSSAIAAVGQANQISIMSDGQGITFYINGQLVGDSDMAGFEVKRLGVAASVGSDEPVICYFDNLKVYAE